MLFAASCYIAHLIVFDRQQALTLDAYTDRTTEGSHDWDTFMRFMLAQIVPAHIPEVLYSLADARTLDSWQHSVEAICRCIAPAGSAEVRGGGGTAGLLSNRGKLTVRWHT